MKSKPFGDLFWRIRFGYKIWSLCGNDRYPYHLDIYSGKSEGPRNEFGLGEKIVLETVNVLKDMNDDDITKCEFVFDNYFTIYLFILFILCSLYLKLTFPSLQLKPTNVS